MAERNVQEKSRHFGSNDEQEVFDEETRPQQTRAKVVQTQSESCTARRPSVRRKRDYSSQVKWAYELNQDLYRCHIEADKSVHGYSGRLKKLWDQCHPELDHMTSKHLTTQATRIVKKGLVKETRINTEHVIEQEDNNAEKDQENDKQENNMEGDNQEQESRSSSENQEKHVRPGKERFNEEKILEVVEKIKPEWIRNYEDYLRVEIRSREFTTKKDRKIEDIEIIAVNRIMEEVIDEMGNNIDLWHINVMEYVTAITLLGRHGKLREKRYKKTARKTPGWIINITNRINAIRRKLSHINLILQCQKENKYTKKQKYIERGLKKKYGSVRRSRLLEMEAILKHDLKVQAKILRDRKVVAERQRINSLFYSSPKDVYKDFRKNGSIKVKEAPSEEDVKNFWNGIWGHEGVYNEQNEWISKLRDNYCKDVKPTINHIKLEHFLKINESLKNNTSPGLDLIVGYWIKNCHSTRKKTFELFKEVSKGEKDLPEWLVKARTTLAAKNEETRNPKNYRPIACENIMMKTYTGTLALLLNEHLNENNIIAPEQAGAKKGMWGCTDQLLINRVVTNEVTKGRRNVNMIWWDYKKAYDSVPHAWIIEALKLAKVPGNIIGAIQHLIRKWQTELNIPTVNGNIRIGEILYKKGVFQGDYLSVILFILSLNPLSFLLNETEGYKMAINTIYEKIIMHLFFVDDLKLYAATLQQSKLQLDIVTTFS